MVIFDHSCHSPAMGQPRLTVDRYPPSRSIETGGPQRSPLSGSLAPPPNFWRSPYHLIMLVTYGEGSHAIDFTRYPCRRGTVLWARSGQVHEFEAGQEHRGVVVCFADTIVAPFVETAADSVFAPAGPETPVCWQAEGADEAAIVSGFAQIGADAVRHTRREVPTQLIAHQIAALLTRIAALAPRPPLSDLWRARQTERPSERVVEKSAKGAPDLVRRLRVALERDVTHRPVERYAEELGCSVRTLTRACLAQTGHAAKRVLDERIALEAKRLLATTSASAATIGARLGFSEPTNFGRFFTREVGVSPGTFRAAVTSARFGADEPSYPIGEE